jgi:RNA polymerase sigma factor (sigma-70 family)
MAPQLHARAVMPSDGPACELSTLFRLCAAGDTRARETIIVRFLPLACRLARVYEGRGEPIEDLRQAASIGLINAVDRYSLDRGVAFSSYARQVILGEIRHHFRDTTWRVHVPRPIKDRAAQMVHADRELSTARLRRASPTGLQTTSVSSPARSPRRDLRSRRSGRDHSTSRLQAPTATGSRLQR